MPLGIGAGLLAGAGQGILDLQKQAEEKRRQELQQLYVLQTLKNLQGQNETSQFGGFGFTPPSDLSQPTPVGGGGIPSVGTGVFQQQPMGGAAAQSNYTPGKGRGFSIAMQHTPEEQDKVAATIASQGGAQHWANFNPKLRADLQSAGLPTSGPVAPDQMGQFLSLVHKDESMGGQNIPNYRFDRTHTAGGVDQITNSTWREYAPRAGVNAASMGPVDTSPEARAQGAKEIGASPAQFSPQQPPDTYNRAVQEVLKARQQAIQEIIKRTPNATVQQRKPLLDEWDRQAKEWLSGIKEQNTRTQNQAVEEDRFKRNQAAEEGRFQRTQAAEQRRHERNLEEQSKELGAGSNYEITDKDGKVLWQGVAREGKKGGLFDEGGGRLDTQFKDSKITKLPTSQQLIGSRENVLIQRSLTAGIEVATELENLTKLPLGASSGPTGGRKQGPGLLDATKERLANWFTPMNDKFYNDSIAGMGREIGGLVNSGVYINQHTIDSFKQLEFQTTDEPEVKLHKLATLRQNTENALQSVLANPRVAPSQRAFAQQMIDRVQKAVPFTPGDVIGWANSGDPKQTIGQYVQQAQSGAEAGKAEKLGGEQGAAPSYSSADEVKAAVQSGKLDKDGAIKILREQFGMQ